MSNLCRECHTTASEYLRLIATGLGLPPDNSFSKAHDYSSGYLSLLRFPPAKPGSAYSSCLNVGPYFGRGIISLRVIGSNEPPQVRFLPPVPTLSISTHHVKRYPNCQLRRCASSIRRHLETRVPSNLADIA